MRPLPIRLTEYYIDLSGVTTPEQAWAVFAEAFELSSERGPDWRLLFLKLREQEQPYDGVLAIFEGWADFAARMPRWAKRIKSQFGRGYREHLASYGRIVSHFD